MNCKTLLLVAMLLSQQSFSQKNDVWVRFSDPKTYLTGYKDLNGNIKIPTKLDGINKADSFYNIIAIHDSINGHYKWYYLLKNKKKVGIDSVPEIELIPRCESEGKISFVDKKTDHEGVFDKNGTTVIPASYSYVLPFFNGVAVACINAVRRCVHCDRPTWRDGERVLINTNNEILIDSLDRSAFEDINWYSMRVNDFSVDTNIYVNFKGRHGNTYSFFDYKKEFTLWFDKKFKEVVYAGSNSKLEHYCLPEVYYRAVINGNWTIKTGKSLVEKCQPSFFKRWFQKDSLQQISITGSYYLDMGFSSRMRLKKFNNPCGIYFKEKFPVFDVFIIYYKKRQPQANRQGFTKSGDNANTDEFDKKYEYDHTGASIEFIRTETGYKLLSVSPKNEWP